MRNIMQRTAFAAALATALSFVAASDVSAQSKKLSYEQAWATCQKWVQKNYPKDTTDSTGRSTAGAACMKKYGYRLKKGADL